MTLKVPYYTNFQIFIFPLCGFQFEKNICNISMFGRRHWLPGVAVTILGKISVPFVTSQEADINISVELIDKLAEHYDRFLAKVIGNVGECCTIWNLWEESQFSCFWLIICHSAQTHGAHILVSLLLLLLVLRPLCNKCCQPQRKQVNLETHRRTDGHLWIIGLGL